MAADENNVPNRIYTSENGKFRPGNPGKPQGAASNASAKVKAAIQKFLEDNIEQVQESFDQLKPIEKLQFIANILPYAVPKLSSVDSNQETNHKGQITVRWDSTLIPKSTTDSHQQESA